MVVGKFLSCKARQSYPTLTGSSCEQLPPSNRGCYTYALLPGTGRHAVVVVDKCLDSICFDYFKAILDIYLCKQAINSSVTVAQLVTSWL